MKKIISRICLISMIIYFIISSFYTIFYRELLKEDIAVMKQSIAQEESRLMEKDIRMDYIMENQAREYVLNTNLLLIGVSIGIGSFIGLILSVKENSKIKYILYFILGYLFYSLVLIGIMGIVMGKDASKYFLINIYLQNILPIILSYSAIYAIILVANIWRNKSKVKELNETLKGEKQNKRKFNIPYLKQIIIGIVILTIVLFLGNTIRKANILIQYSKNIENFVQSKNYYMKEIIGNNILEYFYKDGIMVVKQGNNTVYYNEETQERVIINENKKACVTTTSQMPRPLVNEFFYEGMHTRFWRSLLEALRLGIKTEKIDGVSYYILDKKYENTLYINKETLLVEKIIQYGISVNESTQEVKLDSDAIQYCYKLNPVTDEQIHYPDLTEYEVYTDITEYNKANNK